MKPGISAGRALAALALAVLAGGTGPAAGEEGETNRNRAAMEQVWAFMVDAGEWRTPNPDFTDPAVTPAEYALRWRFGPHRQHVTGELLGVFDSPDGEKTVLYWSLYSFRNPVTGEITAQQVGSNGAYAAGPVLLTDDGRIVIDQIMYAPNGAMKALRHEDVLNDDGESYQSNVYERDASGDWTLRQRWTWRRAD